ncbi:hypothetical protein SAMN05216215_102116 [Saccharopolyspora shandongensis]|uniref:Uncharacterized protein n=1 Tax=Saccharopolyspora shandongensis TaxID=418495 RepID=A0A1H3HMX0_9PSEU|nr:hypothetical protein [Saccharopolyspora shandongensis]SDY16812.1 hypothetical protein SAMN05216215_102116 [Saccharopolyspora shandongensis]
MSDLGRLDGYVDAIGRMHRRPMEDYGLTDWEHDFTVDLAHAFLAAHALCPWSVTDRSSTCPA